jgi:hypothetical protein
MAGNAALRFKNVMLKIVEDGSWYDGTGKKEENRTR